MTTTLHRPTGRAASPTPSPTAPRPGPVPRRPTRSLVLVGVAGAVLSGLVFAALYQRASARVAALAVARPVAAGAELTAADLREVEVSAGAGLALVPASRRAAVIGRRAAVALVPGALLTEAQLGAGPDLAPGTVLVALALRAGQFPPALAVGDRVGVVVTGQAPPTGGEARGRVVSTGARVAGLDRAPGPGGEGAVVSLVVEATAAPDLLAAAAGGGHVAVVVLPAGP